MEKVIKGNFVRYTGMPLSNGVKLGDLFIFVEYIEEWNIALVKRCDNGHRIHISLDFLDQKRYYAENR